LVWTDGHYLLYGNLFFGMILKGIPPQKHYISCSMSYIRNRNIVQKFIPFPIMFLQMLQLWWQHEAYYTSKLILQSFLYCRSSLPDLVITCCMVIYFLGWYWKEFLLKSITFPVQCRIFWFNCYLCTFYFSGKYDIIVGGNLVGNYDSKGNQILFLHWLAIMHCTKT
jgi:hypothetical protein